MGRVWGALSRVKLFCGALGHPGSSLGGLEAIWADGLPTSRDRSVGRSFILLNEALGLSFILLNEVLPVGGVGAASLFLMKLCSVRGRFSSLGRVPLRPYRTYVGFFFG